jgi:HEAT repeat protein
MGGIGDPAAIPLLEKLLKDIDAGVRWQARESIKNIRSIVAKYPDRLSKKQWWN